MGIKSFKKIGLRFGGIALVAFQVSCSHNYSSSQFAKIQTNVSIQNPSPVVTYKPVTLNFAAYNQALQISSIQLTFVNADTQTVIATVAGNATSYVWTPTIAAMSGAYIKAIATDSQGGTAEADTDPFNVIGGSTVSMVQAVGCNNGLCNPVANTYSAPTYSYTTGFSAPMTFSGTYTVSTTANPAPILISISESMSSSPTGGWTFTCLDTYHATPTCTGSGGTGISQFTVSLSSGNWTVAMNPTMDDINIYNFTVDLTQYSGTIGSSISSSVSPVWTRRPGTWTQLVTAINAPPPRVYHSAVAMNDGVDEKMYIFAGIDLPLATGPTNDLFSYDPSTGAWVNLTPIGVAPAARWGHSAVVMNPGSGDLMYVFGGTTGLTPFGDLHTYNPRTNAWADLTSTMTGEIPSARSSHSAIVLDGVMYIFGGGNSAGVLMNDLYAYTAATNNWVNLTSTYAGIPPAARSSASIAVLDDGTGSKIYIHGSSGAGFSMTPRDLYSYNPNPTSQLWRNLTTPTLGTFPAEFMTVQSTMVLSGKMYLFGGVNIAALTTFNVFVYDPVANVWADTTPPTGTPGAPTSAYFGSTLVNISGTVYMFGGSADPGGTSNELYSFTP